MKYLKYRQEFLHKEIKLESININGQIKTSEMINEAFENDITWGGSLLGRLINSTIRKGKIYFQTMRIGNVINQVKQELDTLVGIAACDEEQRNQVASLQVRFLLTEIYKIVISKDSLTSKLTALVGDKSENSGLIIQTIKEIEKLTNDQLENKDELIEKLKKFRAALLEIDFEPEEPEKDDEEDPNKEGGEGEKDPNTIFFLQTYNLLKSIVSINEVIVNKRVTVSKVEVGKEYIDKNNKVCKVVSIDFEDDAKTKKLKDGLALVIYRDEATKTYKDTEKVKVTKAGLTSYTKGDTAKPKPTPGKPQPNPVTKPGVNPEGGKEKEKEGVKKTTESFFYENESLPLFEEATEIKDNEVHARAAWTKVSNVWIKSGIGKLVPKIEELIKKVKSGDKQAKSDVRLIGKLVIQNKATVGSKPLSFEELIKEAQDTAINNDIPKAISVVSRYLLGFEEDLGLLNSIGDASKQIKLFIDSYKKINEVFPKLKKEEPKKESFNLYNYSKFVLNEEVDDLEMEEESEDDPEGDKPEGEGEEDKVRKEWSKEFKEGEEKEWVVNEEGAKKLQKQLDEKGQKGIEIDADSYKDNIIRIVNLFGKAYGMYAVPVIPSGRPGGRISQKTFREYTYLGSGTAGEWDKESGPKTGPWAANLPFNKWQEGIMGILEDTKYRKVLANTKFKNRGPNQDEGSGLTLFNFINDMLGSGDKGSDFRVNRHAILKKYFEGVIDEKQTETPEAKPGKIPNSELGDKNQLSFVDNQIGIKFPYNIKKLSEKGQFFKIEYKDSEGNKDYLIGIFFERIKTTHLILKFNQSKSGKIQTIISKYLKGSKIPTDLQLKEDQKLYVGLIEFSSIEKIKQNEEITIKRALVDGNESLGDVEDFKIKVSKIQLLAQVNDKKVWEIFKLEGEPKEKPAKDITKIERIKTKFGIR